MMDTRKEQKIEQYLTLLEKWNKSINLTAIRDRDEMYALHIQDSLTVLPYVEEQLDLVDIGSGAGLPGIPLAIFCPNKIIALVEPNQKKATFLKHVVMTLQLENVEVINQRAQDWRSDKLFTSIITRAFTDLKDMVMVSEHLLSKGGKWFAMKGVWPYDEIEKLSQEIMTEVVSLKIPNRKEERHLVIMQRAIE